jgi:hypothetical protein
MNIIVTKKFAKNVDKELNEQQKQQLAQILISITQSKTISEIPPAIRRVLAAIPSS